jgi:hypothetical protein
MKVTVTGSMTVPAVTEGRFGGTVIRFPHRWHSAHDAASTHGPQSQPNHAHRQGRGFFVRLWS